jgi:hypothetical protein
MLKCTVNVLPSHNPAVILTYGANRALRPPFMDMSASSQEAMAYEEAAEAGEMQLHTTFMFVITASCSLVLIFYFMSGSCVRSYAGGPQKLGGA